MTSTEKVLAVLSLICMLCVPACATRTETLTPPSVTQSPYDSSRGNVLFAVAPLANESGTTVFQPDAVTDAVVRAVADVRGIDCLPNNRVIAVMRGMGLRELRSPSDASALADALGVDALIVGTITAYDPYDPPTLGIALALHAGPVTFENTLDLDELRGSTTSTDAPSEARFVEAPITTVSTVLAARNHDVQMDVRQYAEGRINPEAPRGWRTYLASMPLYTEYAAHAAVSRLLDMERLRLARARRPESSR